MRKRVVVVGAGLSGLVAALELSQDHEVVLIEAARRLGGKVLTGSFRGSAVELGPDAFITRNPAARQLCADLGLEDELVAPARAGAAVFARGRLRPLPSGLALGVPTDFRALARSGVLPPRAMLRAALDLVLPGFGPFGPPRGRDPSVAEVVARRMGPAVLATLVDPLLGGINAGDTARLSLAACAPDLAAAIEGRSSLVRALKVHRRSAASASNQAPGHAPERAQAAEDRPAAMFLGLRPGLSRLVDELGRALVAAGVELRLGTEAVRVSNAAPRSGQPAGWALELQALPGLRAAPGLYGSPGVRASTGPHNTPEVLEADALVLATPAATSAKLLRELAGSLSALLSRIRYASVALLVLAWPAGAVPELYGTGFLVPRQPGRLVTAVTNLSAKWPQLPPPGETWLRASVGHDGDETGLDLDDGELAERVRHELESLTGISAPPLELLVTRWPAAFPQYAPGHIALVQEIEAASASLARLALCGAAYRGIGMPACILDGRRAARQLGEALRE